MIEVENLSKSYGPTLAVDSVSFKVEPREVLGFLGPNGAGKTTTMKILTGYLTPDSGRAMVGGIDVMENSLEVRRKIGYLPENAPLYSEMNVLEYLNFVCEVRRIPKNERRLRQEEMIASCGLEPVLKKDIGALSKGYRQRVGLAQAMIHGPEVLILDEPTTGLDPNQIIEIRNLIRAIGKEKTVILSTHILPEVTATCSRVVIISGGKIAGEGTTEDLSKQASAEEQIVVAIKGPAAEVADKLRAASGMLNVQRGDDAVDGAHRFTLAMKRDAANGERLFKVVVDNNWVLTEMSRSQASLEDIFKRLTTSGGAA
ncbi:MAG: ATP-binding cassette domain-containing protein [Chrysiogenetes bacterium]|nr:ATP-binding cassette domain-containing protein [Chrysiogenetes bacterium]